MNKKKLTKSFIIEDGWFFDVGDWIDPKWEELEGKKVTLTIELSEGEGK